MKFISEKAGSKAVPTKVIAYVLDNAKACRDKNGQIFMATIGLDEDRPYSQQFRETAMLTGNKYEEHDRKYYHFKYTCSPDDYDPKREKNNITPEQLLDEAITLCNDQLTGYQALVVVQYHNNCLTGSNRNKAHLHAHIIVNASPYDTNLKRLRLSNKDLQNLRDYAYEAGRKYELHEKYWLDEVAEKRKRKEQLSIAHTQMQDDGAEGIRITGGEREIIKKHGSAFADKSFKERYRIAIDEAREEVTTLPMFQAYLQKHFSIKTQITQQGNIKFKLPDRTTYTSGQKLGENYTLEAITQSLVKSKESHMEDFTSLAGALGECTYDADAQLIIIDEQAITWRNKILISLEAFLNWEAEERTQQKFQSDSAHLNDEIRHHQLILEKTEAFYKLCEEAARNETLYIALTKEEKEKIARLRRYREWLAAEEEKRRKMLLQEELRQLLTCKHTGMPSRRITLYDEDGRERTLIEIMILVAIQAVKDMNKRNVQEINYFSRGCIQTDWKAQQIMDSIRIARELGATSLAELELKVEEEGRKFGKIKKEYHKERQKFIAEMDEATASLVRDDTLSAEEQAAEIEKIRRRWEEKINLLDTSYAAAKKHYSQCAYALDHIHMQQYRQMDYSVQESKSNYAAEEDEISKGIDDQTPHRTAAEAKKIAEMQMQEIRNWVDMAICAIAKNPSTGEDVDLEEWKSEMEKHGCQIRITKNTISVKHPNSNQPVRLNRLGGNYEKERIIHGISIQKQQYNEQRRNAQSRVDPERIEAELIYTAAVRTLAESIGTDPEAGCSPGEIDVTEIRAGKRERILEGPAESNRSDPNQRSGHGTGRERSPGDR